MYPEPNAFKLDLKSKYEFQQLVLGSFEFPMSQYTIESSSEMGPGWDHFCYDTGESFTGGARFAKVAVCAGPCLAVPSSPAQKLLCLPDLHQVMKHIGSGIWTLDGDDQCGGLMCHGLTNAFLDAFHIGAASIHTLSGVSGEVDAVHDDTTLSVSSLSECPLSEKGILAVKMAGGQVFANPLVVAEALNRNAASNSIPLRFWYDEAALQMMVECSGCAGGYVEVLYDPSCSLFEALGIWRAPAPLIIREGCPVGGAYPTVLNSIVIPPGNYDPQSLCNALANCVHPAAMLNFSSAAGDIRIFLPSDEVVIFSIPAKAYTHPGQVVLDINTILGTSTIDHMVEATFRDGAFSFRSRATPPQKFSLDWSSASESALRLGFQPTRLPFSTQHLARSRVRPVTNERGEIGLSPVRLVEGKDAGTLQSIQTTKKYIFECRTFRVRGQFGIKLKPSSSKVYSKLPLPVGTLVRLKAGEECGMYAAVKEKWNGFTKLSPLVPLSQAVLEADETDPVKGEQVLVNTDSAVCNFYFRGSNGTLLANPPCCRGPFSTGAPGSTVCWDRLAEILGYKQGANLWPTVKGLPEAQFVAPYQWNLDPPSYVLLDLGIEHMSANVVHRCGQDIKGPRLIGKIPLYPPFKTERQYPLQAIGTGVSTLTSVFVTVYNPWHALYRFHGRNHSLTLVLADPLRKSAVAECI